MKTSKYEYLMALSPGETEIFDNLPTVSEGRRKVAPTSRKAYYRINSAIAFLMAKYKGTAFTMHVQTSTGSRIPGNQIAVRMVSNGDTRVAGESWENYETRRTRAMEAWKLRKQREDAPKLPGQLEEARKAEAEQRVERAKAQAIRPAEPHNKYDPKRLAELVLAHSQGEQIQLLQDDGHWSNVGNPSWTAPTARYRVKPKRRQFYLVVGRNGDVTAAADDLTKLPHHDPACLVLAVEVIEEDA